LDSALGMWVQDLIKSQNVLRVRKLPPRISGGAATSATCIDEEGAPRFAIQFTDLAAPGHQALGWMLLHPLGKPRGAHQAGLHRDISQVRGGDSLFVAICRRGETAEHG